MTQRERIYQLLVEKGEDGAHMRELNAIAYRYTARIDELRKDGYNISTVQLGRGNFKYVLHEDSDV